MIFLPPIYYDPSLPIGILYYQRWKLDSDYTLRARFTYRADRPEPREGDQPTWQMYQDGYGLMGVAIGARSVFESYESIVNAIVVGWSDDRKLGFCFPTKPNKKSADQNLQSKESIKLKPGDRCELVLKVETIGEKNARATATLTVGNQSATTSIERPVTDFAGYAGVAARGLIDFEVNRFEIDASGQKPSEIGANKCVVCYPLGDSLRKVDGKWQVRFVGMFASDGEKIEIRIADSEQPDGGWSSVPVAGVADIVNNDWRRNTAVVYGTLPVNPADKTLYYTVWKDGIDVTADGRIGTDACGPGTGLVGDVPASGNYVGRLPQLTAPYKLCGLSCHAINEGLQERDGDGWKMTGHKKEWIIRDQPTVEAYKHLDDYKFQVMVWEDDVWYMELVLYPPSTDDAYNVVAQSICGPTSRWQMMRHWNVINPGDHDYGMDDVKGPEQLILRHVEGLGQDPDYLRRNFQIVHHLVTGDEEVDPLANPKKWRAWKMPDRDFTLIVLDSRLWRSSQDVDIWDDAGWGKFKSLYDRTDPTRSLLGEEQFGWLQEQLTTDSSRLICLTGISGLHTIWTGAKYGNAPSKDHPKQFDQRDRVTADYAGWVKAGADRVLELLGARDGIVTVYGDVHNGCIMKNEEHRIIECSFGPIGRTGGRGIIPGFGKRMKDVDDRLLDVFALYHMDYADIDLNGHADNDPLYWNFLEMEFDPRPADPSMGFRIRNLIDAPAQIPRGGSALETVASTTGRSIASRVPKIKTIPDADVQLTDAEGRSIRATRSDSGGHVHLAGLVEVAPGQTILMTAFDGAQVESRVVKALPVS